MASIISDQDSWSQYSFAPCSPCSSGVTFVHDAEDVSQSTQNTPKLTILLPNLTDRFSVALSDLQDFVSQRLGAPVEVTISHLLIYLFSINSDPSVTFINNLKLLHTGRPFSIQRSCDLSDRSPEIRDLVDRFPTFQLIIMPSFSSSPLKMSVDMMLSKMKIAAESRHSPSVTYAEAMVKLFRNSTSRKSSVGSIESPTRYASRDSATDIEDNENFRLKGKLRNSLKRMFKKKHSTGPQERMTETLLISL